MHPNKLAVCNSLRSFSISSKFQHLATLGDARASNSVKNIADFSRFFTKNHDFSLLFAHFYPFLPIFSSLASMTTESAQGAMSQKLLLHLVGYLLQGGPPLQSRGGPPSPLYPTYINLCINFGLFATRMALRASGLWPGGGVPPTPPWPKFQLSNCYIKTGVVGGRG